MIDNFSILVSGLVIVFVIFKARQRHLAENSGDKQPSAPAAREPGSQR